MESRENIAKQLKTIRDMMRWGVSRFTESKLHYGHGCDRAWDEVWTLLRNNLHLPVDTGDEVLDAQLTLEERLFILVVFETRIRERMPAAYLTGEAWFAGLRFKVDERVIVPRSPIAELIENGFQPWLGKRPEQVGQVLDLCTGSGCIGIACSVYFPEAQVDLVDISDEALEVATMNVTNHDVQDRVNVIKSDLFSALNAEQQYDLIVSNPPYVDAEDLASMPAEFGHEPSLALDGGADGLDLARRILYAAADYLQPEGILVMEVGNSGMTMQQLYPQIPFLWVEFERGGDGVMVFNREELLQYRESFG